eukprot:COSAG02_NODE_1893_length_10476_cov_3.336224_4_plen_176_part_00
MRSCRQRFEFTCDDAWNDRNLQWNHANHARARWVDCACTDHPCARARAIRSIHTAVVQNRIRTRSSLECASLSWALLQVHRPGHCSDATRLQGAVWSMLAPSRGVPRLGTSTSSASQTRYGPAFRRASAIPFYVAAPPDQSGRARGYPTQSTTLYIILIFAKCTALAGALRSSQP